MNRIIDKNKFNDNATYYYTKTLGDLMNNNRPHSQEDIDLPGETEMKNIYNKVKGCKNINDLLDKIKNMGEILNKPEYKDKKNLSKKGINKEDESGNDNFAKVQYVKVGGGEINRKGSNIETKQYIIV